MIRTKVLGLASNPKNRYSKNRSVVDLTPCLVVTVVEDTLSEKNSIIAQS